MGMARSSSNVVESSKSYADDAGEKELPFPWKIWCVTVSMQKTSAPKTVSPDAHQLLQAGRPSRPARQTLLVGLGRFWNCFPFFSSVAVHCRTLDSMLGWMTVARVGQTGHGWLQVPDLRHVGESLHVQQSRELEYEPATVASNLNNVMLPAQSLRHTRLAAKDGGEVKENRREMGRVNRRKPDKHKSSPPLS